MTVRELLSRIDSAEITEWMAYEMLEAGYKPAAPVDDQLRAIFGGR